MSVVQSHNYTTRFAKTSVFATAASSAGATLHEVEVSTVPEDLKATHRRVNVITPINWTVKQATAIAVIATDGVPFPAKLKAQRELENVNADDALIVG